jgi:hypothetical protein
VAVDLVIVGQLGSARTQFINDSAYRVELLLERGSVSALRDIQLCCEQRLESEDGKVEVFTEPVSTAAPSSSGRVLLLSVRTALSATAERLPTVLSEAPSSSRRELPPVSTAGSSASGRVLLDLAGQKRSPAPREALSGRRGR